MTNLKRKPLLRTTFPALGRALLLLLFCSIAGARAFADDRAAARLFTQDFYKAYTAASDPGRFVTKSDKITPEFKKAYAAYMKKGPESDPIIQGQDVPASGYQAKEIELKDNQATVTMTTRDKGFSTLKVHVVWNGRNWLFNGVNGLKGK